MKLQPTQKYQFIADLFHGIGVPMVTQTVYEAVKDPASKKWDFAGGYLQKYPRLN